MVSIRGAEIAQLARRADTSLQYDYIILLNRMIPVIAVVEMARRPEHQDLVLGPWGSPSSDGKQSSAVAVSSNLHRLMSGTLVGVPRLDPAEWLTVTLHYSGYRSPHFDVRHTGFEVEFFAEDQESVKLPEELIATYETAEDMARIFIRSCDDARFCAADMLVLYFDLRGATLEEITPEQERRSEESTFEMIFEEGLFYMETQSGRRSIRKLLLRVEISWLPRDNARPTIGDLPQVSDPA